MDKSKQLLEKVNKLIESEGGESAHNLSPVEKLDKYIIPGLENSKNTLGELYKFQPKDKAGIIGRLKNIVLSRLKNITVNTIERESMRQQKFNELTYQAILEMREELEKIKTSSNK